MGFLKEILERWVEERLAQALDAHAVHLDPGRLGADVIQRACVGGHLRERRIRPPFLIRNRKLFPKVIIIRKSNDKNSFENMLNIRRKEQYVKRN